MRTYFALIHRHDRNRYSAEIPDFPCCIADGPNADVALAKARQLVATRVRALRQAAMPLPRSRSLPAAMTERSGRPIVKAVAITTQ